MCWALNHSEHISLLKTDCSVPNDHINTVNILHKNYTYVIRKRNLTTSLLFQKIVYYIFRPLGPSSSDIFEDFLLYCDTSIIFTSVRLSIAS
jgi:hypothetical protein